MPISGERRRITCPREPCKVVDNAGKIVNHKPRIRPGNASKDITILAGPKTWNDVTEGVVTYCLAGLWKCNDTTMSRGADKKEKKSKQKKKP